MKTTTTSAATTPDTFRVMLQAELAGRCARNPHYSLRAFAKFLGVHHATLSQLLRGKRRLTARVIEKLGGRLGLGADTIQRYLAINDASFDRFPGLEATPEVKQLTCDVANLIAEGHHYTILELTRLRDFVPDSRWIARVLGISSDDVNVALTRLVRLDLLEMAGERWIDKSGAVETGMEDFALTALRNVTEQARRLMLSASRSLPAGLREYSSTTIALDSSRLPQIIAAIARFRQELLGVLEQDRTRDDVYQLDISLFPVTTLKHAQETEHGTTRDAVPDRGPQPRKSRRVLRQGVRLEDRRQ
ncbi:MAG: TIGR02147 family protein [Planctomycetes bacterium]|nr:TIGR02147 family protein [Planctomycetota bacterium]